MKHTFLPLLFAALLLLAGCDKKPDVTDNIPIPPQAEGSVFILNEGNFQFGNASLTLLDRATAQVYADVFESTNKRKLGDVLQSALLVNGNLFLTVNNSQKIEVISPETYKSVKTINGFVSPRYMLQLNNKLYVSEYYADAVRVVDLASLAIVKSIPITGWGDEMAYYNGKLYVCNADRNLLYIINTTTDVVTDSVVLSEQPASVLLDANRKLWVLCKGSKQKSINPKLFQLDADNDEILHSYTLGSYEDGASRLRINKAGNRLYWISKNVYSMSISDDKLPSMPFVVSLSNNFYGLGIDPYTDEIFVSDAVDYVQRSSIYRYSESGSLKGQFKAGIITGDFYFYKK